MIIYHNPRCSKSRQTLALLEKNGVEPTVVKYLETPLDGATIKGLLDKLNVDIRTIVRSGEEAYKQLGLDDTELSQQALIDAIVKHPKLLERPIVVKNNKAVIGRPPENVLALL